MTRSALVVVVAEAESLVASLRLAHDPMAVRGVPAHVTVLYPFRDVVDESTAQAVELIASGIDSFAATFNSIGRFPGEFVFLSPDSAERFRQMTLTFLEAFPDCPPYGGAFADPDPHLTVASRVDVAIANRLDVVLNVGLPISTQVERLTLLVEDDEGQWAVGKSWPLRDHSSE